MVSITILLLICIPIFISLLLDIPAIQNAVLKRAMEAASKSLETRVSIDRIDLSLFNRVAIKGFYVEDYQGDTLLYVGNVRARLSSAGLFGGSGIVLANARAEGVRLNLKDTPSGEMNIRQIVTRLSDPNKPKKGNFKLSIDRAKVDDMYFSLVRNQKRNPEYGVDYGNMHIYDIDSEIESFTIDGTAIHTNIEALSGRERSGFKLDNLTGLFYMVNGSLGFEGVQILTPHSDIELEHVSLVGGSWAEYREFVDTVLLDVAIKNSRLASDDVAYFAPKLRDWDLVFNRIDASMMGSVSGFELDIDSFEFADSTSLVASAYLSNLPDINNTHFDLSIDSLSTSATDLNRLTTAITQKGLSEGVVDMLTTAGELRLKAKFEGLLSSFDMQADIVTDLGGMSCNLRAVPMEHDLRDIKGDVVIDKFNLSPLLPNNEVLGSLSMGVVVDGVVGRGYTDAEITGSIDELQVMGYSYDSLQLDGHLKNRLFDGHIEARDENLQFDFLGLVDLNDTTPRYDFTLDLRRANLAALNLNRRDSVSILSAKVVANASGLTIDDIDGSVTITDAKYSYNDKSVEADRVSLVGRNSQNSKYVELESDFVDLTFRSKSAYRDVFDYLRQSVWRYLPILQSDALGITPSDNTSAIANDYSYLSVEVDNLNPVLDAVVEKKFMVADNSSMSLLFNPASDQLTLKLSSDYIESGSLLATRLNVNAQNRGDSLTLYASSEDLYAGGIHLPNTTVTGGARQGSMQLSMGFRDTTTQTSGRIGLGADVISGKGTAGRTVKVRVVPSTITRGTERWSIMARSVILEPKRVVVDTFFVSNRDQYLLLDGIASGSSSDSVTLSMRNFDISPFSQFVSKMGYELDGRMSGEAMMRSVFKQGALRANIDIDSLSVNGVDIPKLSLQSTWDVAKNRADLSLKSIRQQQPIIVGFYRPSEQSYYARADLHSVDMGLLDPILTSVISNTQGRADATLILQGEGRNAALSGSVEVDSLSTMVDYTKVRYTIPKATLNIEDNRFKTTSVPVYDREGNRGDFSFSMDMNNLSNISYSVLIEPKRMLVLNTTEEDNDLFYGRMFATGTAQIKGDRRGVEMDIAATTDNNSKFSMPLSGSTNISYADFVRFKTPQTKSVEDVVEERKRQFERTKKSRFQGESKMAISLDINVLPNVNVDMSVSGSVIKAQGTGQLSLEIIPSTNTFNIFGDYTITNGTYLFTLMNIIEKRFTIDSGSSITWTGSPMDALLNIDAIYEVKASLQPLLQGSSSTTADRSVPVDCIISLTDRLSNPAVSFDVEVPSADPEIQTLIANILSSPESVDMQFLYLLIFNSFMSEGSLATSGAGSAISSATGMEMLSGMLSSWLSADDYNIVIRYRPSTELSNEEVDFGLSRSLVNNRLFVELEGNYLIDNTQSVNGSASNFMGEAYITYYIDKSGALQLKAFTQTIDRFNENQGMQETGIGVSYKEDFNNLKDLRRRVKERFSSEDRRERKRQRELERERKREDEKEQDRLLQEEQIKLYEERNGDSSYE